MSLVVRPLYTELISAWFNRACSRHNLTFPYMSLELRTLAYPALPDLIHSTETKITIFYMIFQKLKSSRRGDPEV